MLDNYEEFKRQVFTLTGIDLSAYKERQMKRRIDALIQKNGVKGYPTYVELLKKDDLAGVLSYLQDMAEILTHTASRLLRGVTVHRLDLQMLIATDDVAETAQKYGKVCGIVYPTVAAIAGVVRVRRRRLRIEPNFLLEKSAVRFDISIGIPVWRMLTTGGSLLWNVLLLLGKIEPQKNKEVVSNEK